MKLFLLVLLIMTSGWVAAREGKPPLSLSHNLTFDTKQSSVVLPEINVDQLLQKHQFKANEAKPLRFAVPNEFNISPLKHGQWQTIQSGPEAGGQVWQMRFSGKNATDINFGFGKFNLPEGVELHFISYADNPAYYDGPYTAKDNRSYNEFWSAPLPGGDVAVELFVPKGIDKQNIVMQISRVNSGFRDVFKRYGGQGLRPKQGSCNNDVVCPVGDDWRDEIRSVAAYTVGGTDTCTGTMVMDADQTFTPYFVTAYHCGLSTGNASSVVTIWNYESANCGDLSGGSRLDTVSGAIYRASREDVDSSLIELSSVPPENYNVYWAGWDRSGIAPQGSVGIHHPGVDEKAISFNDDALTTRSSCILGSGPNDTHWNVDNWEDGTTEPGSSGSGLWDPDNHRLVGFLSGGQAACGNTQYDCYGRFSEAWDNGGADSVNFKSWLDPSATGVTFIEGSNPNPFSITATPTALAVCQADDAVYPLAIALSDAGFSENITLSVIDLPSGASAGFSNNPVLAPASSTLTLSDTALVTPGEYDMTVNGLSTSNSVNEALSLRVDAAAPNAAVNLLTPADMTTGVDTVPVLTWDSVATAAEYRVELATDAGFTSVIVDETVSDTSLTVPQLLSPDSAHYWRVTALNGCGTGQVSAVYQFTTANEICFTGSTGIPDSNTNGVDIQLNVIDAFIMGGMRVSADITHTYVGDLSIALSHNGTDVTLMDRPGYTGSGFGCSESNVLATFDDASAILVENECSTSPPAIGGVLQPEQALSQFNDTDISGLWTFNVSDSAGGDTGTVNQLCLLPEKSDLIFMNGFE